MDGKLHANIAFPGLTIEYSLDKGKTWLTYSQDVTVNQQDQVMVRSRTADGKRTSRAEIIE